MPHIAITVRADDIPEIDTVPYAHDATAAASVETLRLAFRRLVSHPGLSGHQRRGVAHCLAVLEDFPLVNDHTCVQVSIGPYAIETDSGVLSLCLSINASPGELEAGIAGTFRDEETGMSDSVTTCDLTAGGAGEDAFAQYDDYRQAHAPAIGWHDMPAFDAASFAILPLDDLAPEMGVDFPDDAPEDEPTEGPETLEVDRPWTIRDGLLVADDSCDDHDVALIARGPFHFSRLSLSNTNISDAGLAALRGLPHLVGLDLSVTAITDGAMPHIVALGALQTLELAFTGVTDDSLHSVSSLPQLTYLGVRGTKVSAESFRTLVSHPCLKEIDASDSHVDGDAVAHALSKMTRLEVARLENTLLSGDCLRAFQGHPSIRELYLGANPVFDDDLLSLRQIPGLIRLGLSGTLISDAVVESLAECRNLRYLDISDTGVTQVGLDALGRRLPECHVSWQQPETPLDPLLPDDDLPF